MAIFYTSDQHFGHANILKFEDAARRGEFGQRFYSVEQMDEYLISVWNQSIQFGDIVYCIGDMSYKQSSLQRVLPRLHGHKILIVGNHDPYFKRMTCQDSDACEFMVREAQQDAAAAGFDAIHMELMIDIDGIGKVKLTHLPYAPINHDGMPYYDLRYLDIRPKKHEELVLLCGHVHSQWESQRANYPGLMLNVGCDINSLTPFAESEIVERYASLMNTQKD
jgi:calcineurin-like phosphoesterase family protein